MHKISVDQEKTIGLYLTNTESYLNRKERKFVDPTSNALSEKDRCCLALVFSFPLFLNSIYAQYCNAVFERPQFRTASKMATGERGGMGGRLEGEKFGGWQREG